MADFSADNAADSFSEDVNRIDGELQNDELLNWMPDFSQQSSGFNELCQSIFGDYQDADATRSSPCKAEDSFDNIEGVCRKKYLALSPDGRDERSRGSQPSPNEESAGIGGSDLHCQAESLHSGQSPENVPCGPPPYCSYWGFETPGPSSDYTQAVLNALLTPPDSPHPLPRLVGYAEFLEIVKACVAVAVRTVIYKRIRKECYGCEVNHPSQRQHACLYPPDPWYLSTNFEKLLPDLWTWEFLPALKFVLEKKGLDIVEARVEGAADAFLYELKAEENVLEKIEEVVEAFTEGSIEKSQLLDHFIDFWNS
ncbi:hypothetical protein WMY93_011531 [Mugilogobius chulae]|uniref:Uncharacterized protein n=1 Tax=Mugilogobius chulae TaxID=88201 RepID=A0AAW0P2Y9_9GOBI